jgi:hypothetical protein
MAIVTGRAKLRASEIELVHSQDPDVDPKAAGDGEPCREGCGWVPVSEVRSVRPGATRIKVRSLDDDENTKIRDVEARGAQASARKLAAELGTVAVWLDGGWSSKPSDIRGLVADLALSNVDDSCGGPIALDLLGGWILNASRGISQERQYAVARRLYGLGGGAVDATKSGG